MHDQLSAAVPLGPLGFWVECTKSDLARRCFLSRLHIVHCQDLIDGKYGDNVDASVYERVEMFHTDSAGPQDSSRVISLPQSDPQSAKLPPQNPAPR